MAGVAIQPVAVGLGEVLWDMLPAGKQLGGAPANFAYHAQVLGAAGVVISAIGNDLLGEEIEDRLDEAELAFFFNIDHEHPTGTVSVELDNRGVPRYVIHEQVAWDFLRLDPPKVATHAQQADVVCFGTLAQRSPISRDSIRRCLRVTKSDCLRVFDINLRQNYFDADVVRQSLELANVLKLNDEELPVVADLLGLSGDAIAALLAQFGLRLIALTRGAAGSSLYAPAEPASHHPGYPQAKLVDTVGAGDAFTAAVAMGLLRGDSLEQINDAANRLASYVCSQAGAMPPVPASVLAEIRGGVA